jgi:FkbM family methyltransferase
MVQQIYENLPEFLKAGSARAILAFKKPGLKRIYSEFVSPGDLVFDVGANLGNYAQLFLDLGVKVVSVEPQPYCIERLNDRFENIENITIVPKGLGSEICNLPFYVSSKSHATSTFSKEWKSMTRFKERKWNKRLDVQVTTLNNLIRKYGIPSFIKIDVEGFESEVLEGLTTPVLGLSIEFGMEYFDSTKKCIKRLMSLGNPQFNYVPFFGTGYALEEYQAGGQLVSHLKKKGKAFGGDIYVKFV